MRSVVRLNGDPVPGGNLSLISRKPLRFLNLRIDRQGRIHGCVPPGAYELQVLHGTAGNVAGADVLRLAAGQHFRDDLDFHRRELVIRLVGPDGRARAGVQVHVGAWGQPGRRGCPATDERGVTRVGVSQRSYPVWVWPEDLSDGAARRALYQRLQADPGTWTRRAIRLGVVPAGSVDTRLELELPARAGY